MKYYIPDQGEAIEDAREVPNTTEGDPRYFCEEAAEHYHNFRDGWEAAWPLTFKIVDDEQKIIGSFTVERESIPRFSATQLPCKT